MAPESTTIHIDSAYAQEIVEFWMHKYHQLKVEFDQLKVFFQFSVSVYGSLTRYSTALDFTKRQPSPEAIRHAPGPGPELAAR